MSRQAARLKSLTKDAQTALEALRKQAEAEPSQRYVRLSEKCARLVRDIAKLTNQKASLEAGVAEGIEQAERIDIDIIEADAILRDLQWQTGEAKKRLLGKERRAEFQAGIVAALEADLIQMEVRLDNATKLKSALEADQTKLAQAVNKKQQQLRSLDGSINDKQTILETLEKNVTEVTKSLKDLVAKDKNFRRGLADEKLRLSSERENLKIEKQALKQDVAIRKQLEPKWKAPPSSEVRHFTL